MVIILYCLRNNEKKSAYMFSPDNFCLVFSTEVWLNQQMQNSQIHRINYVGFQRRGNLDAHPGSSLCPTLEQFMLLNSENLKGHILLQERGCHIVLFCFPLLDGSSKNYVKSNLFHPMKRDYQWCIVIHICDPNTWEAEVGLWIWDQPNPCSETFCHKIIKQSTETRCGSAHL